MVSNKTINNYKDNIELIMQLNMKIKSGSFTKYDIDLYKALIKNNKNDDIKVKTLHN